MTRLLILSLHKESLFFPSYSQFLVYCTDLISFWKRDPVTFGDFLAIPNLKSWSGLQKVPMGLTVDRQIAKKLIVRQPSKTQYFYRQPSNEQASVRRQMLQISLIKN